MLSIAELCQGLVEIEKSTIYPFVNRLIRLILTLPVSTTTTERAFSAMKIIKTRLRNRMENDFLANYLILSTTMLLSYHNLSSPLVQQLSYLCLSPCYY
jgi:hypothetical protein